MLETVAIAGEIVPLCQTGTEKTALTCTLLGADTDPGIAWSTYTVFCQQDDAFGPVAGAHTATKIVAMLELEIELLSRRNIMLSSTG